MVIILLAIVTTAVLFGLAILAGNAIAKFLTKRIGTPAEDFYNKYVKPFEV